MDQTTTLNPDARSPQRTRLAISPEQFVPDHLFLHIQAGVLRVYDGHQTLTLHAGDYYLVRKNRLVRYDQGGPGLGCELTFFCFEQGFLRSFQAKQHLATTRARQSDTFVLLDQTELLRAFMQSLIPYRDEAGKLATGFAEVKYEELLLILLQQQPALANILFDYGLPGKTQLEEFMNRNFRFNVNLPRFAFLTGRSLSAFKRDFHAIFNQTPSRWLLQKRLQEAYFLLDKEHQKPSVVYFELGFKDLSHFSFAFKKRFGVAPSELGRQSKTPGLGC